MITGKNVLKRSRALVLKPSPRSTWLFSLIWRYYAWVRRQEYGFPAILFVEILQNGATLSGTPLVRGDTHPADLRSAVLIQNRAGSRRNGSNGGG